MSFGPHLLLALLEGTVTACVLAVTALGLSLVFGVMRIVNVAHGEFYMLGAVLAWFCASMVGGLAARRGSCSRSSSPPWSSVGSRSPPTGPSFGE